MQSRTDSLAFAPGISRNEARHVIDEGGNQRRNQRPNQRRNQSHTPGMLPERGPPRRSKYKGATVDHPPLDLNRGNHGSSTAIRGNHGSSAAIRAHTMCRWRAPPHEAWWFGRCRCRVARLADVRLDRGERCGAHLSNDRAAPDSLLKLVAREACPCERIEERRLPRRGLAHESDAIGPADEGGHQRRNQRRPS